MSLTALLMLLATGIVSGLLAGLFGIGGGVVIVPALLFAFTILKIGAPWAIHIAIGCSLAIIIGTSLSSTLTHHRKLSVKWNVVLALAVTIIPGTLVGSWLIARMDGFWVERIFACFLLLVGIKMLFSKQEAGVAKNWHQPPTLLLGLEGFVIGVLSAMVGIGGGTVIVPILKFHGMDLRHAIGTSAAFGIFIACAGTVGFMLNGYDKPNLPPFSTGFVYWPAVLCTLITSMPMAIVGAKLAYRLNRQVLARCFAIVLILIALRLYTS